MNFPQISTMSDVVKTIHLLIECNRKLIVKLRCVNRFLTGEYEELKTLKKVSSIVKIGGGIVTTGSVMSAPFTSGLSLSLCKYSVPVMCGGIIGNKLVDILPVLTDFGIITKMRALANEHDHMAKKLQIKAENMCQIADKLIKEHKLERKDAVEVVIRSVIEGILEVADVVITYHVSKNVASKLIGGIKAGRFNCVSYEFMSGGVCFAFAKEKLSESHNETFRVIAKLISFGIDQVDKIPIDLIKVPLVFGFGVGNIIFSVVDELECLEQHLNCESAGIQVVNCFIDKLEEEINSLSGLMQNNNYNNNISKVCFQ